MDSYWKRELYWRSKVDSIITVSKKDSEEGVNNIRIGNFQILNNLFFIINRNQNYKSVTMAGSKLIKRNDHCRIKKSTGINTK